MVERQIIHIPNPRATRIEFGRYNSGIKIELTRRGIEVWGYYDGMVGIEGGFIPWEEFGRLREAARLPLKDARAALEAEQGEAPAE